MTDYDIKPHIYYEDEYATILLGDSTKIIEQFPMSHFDVIFTDPPYGIGLDYGENEDQRPPYRFWVFARRSLKKQGTLHMTVGINELPEWFTTMKLAGFRYRHMSVYWNERRSRKLADGGATPRGDFYCLGADWEPWIHYSREDFEGHFVTTKRLPSDIFQHPGAKESKHPAERDISAWRAMAELFVKPGMLVLDPFLGTGTTLVVCKEIGAKVIGIEREEHWAEYTKNRLSQTTIFEQAALS